MKRYLSNAHVGAGFKPARIDVGANNKHRAGLKPAPTRRHGFPEIMSRLMRTLDSRLWISFAGVFSKSTK